MKESAAEMRDQKEAAIERWENEGGEILTAASPSTAEPSIERRENEGGARQHIGEVRQQPIQRDVMAPSVVDHDPAPDQGPGPEGFIQFFTKFREAFPDLNVSVEQMVADDYNVAIADTITGSKREN